MTGSYDEMMGSPSDPADHPATSMPQATQHYAGDVLPFPESKATPYPMSVGIANSQSMQNIARDGAKAVDTTNLKLLRPK